MKSAHHYYEDILLGNSTQNIIDNALVQTLPEGFHFNAHLHYAVEVFVCLEGECTITVHQTPVRVSKGEYMVIFPNNPHSCDTPAHQGCTLLQIHFHPNVFQTAFTDNLKDHHLFFLIELNLNQKKYLKTTCSDQLHDCLRFIREEHEKKETNYRRMVDLYCAQLLILISRDVSKTIGHDDLRTNRHLLAAHEYLEAHYPEKITVEKLAEYCGISTSFLSRLFKTHSGMNASAYITCFRISKSIELMTDSSNGYTLTELALESGFGSLAHYSRVFKEVMNLSPSKYFILPR